MEKPIIKHEEAFKKWLPNNNVNSVDTYVTYLRNTCKATNANSIDELLNEIVERAIKEHLATHNFTNDKYASDCRSGVEKYWDFLRHLGQDMNSK